MAEPIFRSNTLTSCGDLTVVWRQCHSLLADDMN